MFKILVVEDNAELNRSVCSFLNRSGYEATGCLNANDAYDAMYENMFDLIVSDIMMPEIDGFEFAQTVRSLNEEIPILFMTARDDLASKQRGYRVGIDDYMVKPIDLDELCLRIGALLRRAKIAASRKENTAWRLSGTPEPDGFLNITCFQLDVKQALEKAGDIAGGSVCDVFRVSVAGDRASRCR